MGSTGSRGSISISGSSGSMSSSGSMGSIGRDIKKRIGSISL